MNLNTAAFTFSSPCRTKPKPVFWLDDLLAGDADDSLALARQRARFLGFVGSDVFALVGVLGVEAPFHDFHVRDRQPVGPEAGADVDGANGVALFRFECDRLLEERPVLLAGGLLVAREVNRFDPFDHLVLAEGIQADFEADEQSAFGGDFTVDRIIEPADDFRVGASAHRFPVFDDFRRVVDQAEAGQIFRSGVRFARDPDDGHSGAAEFAFVQSRAAHPIALVAVFGVEIVAYDFHESDGDPIDGQPAPDGNPSNRVPFLGLESLRLFARAVGGSERFASLDR